MKGKTLLCLALVISMLLGVVMIGPVGAQSTTMGVEPDSIVDPGLGPGSTFTVEVWVRNHDDIKGVEFKLGYDTTVLTATLIEYGDIFGPTYFPLMSEINDTEGWMHYGIMQSLGEPGVSDGRAAIITFDVDSVGESDLHLYETKIGDSSVPPVPVVHDTLDGYFNNLIGPPPDFSISADPDSLTIQKGSSDTSTITITSLNGFDSAVDLTVSGEPSGVTATLDPVQVTPPADGSDTSILTVEVDATASTGTYALTVTGTSGTLVHGVDISLEITEPPAPSATLARRSAWPEHHHYSIGKDEDSSNDLFAIVSNDGDVDTWVKVVFSVTDLGGNLVGDFETDPILLPAGGMYGHKGDARYNTAFVPPSVGKHYVSAQCWADTDGDTVPDTPMGKIKTFSFNVVE